jgi:predicted nucleic acid-binding protein
MASVAVRVLGKSSSAFARHMVTQQQDSLPSPSSNMSRRRGSSGDARSCPISRKIEGEQAARGISIAFEDLLIGSTALQLGYSVASLNARHFQLIPRLSVVQL